MNNISNIITLKASIDDNANLIEFTEESQPINLKIDLDSVFLTRKEGNITYKENQERDIALMVGLVRICQPKELNDIELYLSNTNRFVWLSELIKIRSKYGK